VRKLGVVQLGEDLWSSSFFRGGTHRMSASINGSIYIDGC